MVIEAVIEDIPLKQRIFAGEWPRLAAAARGVEPKAGPLLGPWAATPAGTSCGRVLKRRCVHPQLLWQACTCCLVLNT